MLKIQSSENLSKKLVIFSGKISQIIFLQQIWILKNKIIIWHFSVVESKKVLRYQDA